MSSRLAEGLDRPRRIKRERRPQRSGRAPAVLPILRRGPLRGTAAPRATLGGQRGSGGRACGSGVRALALRTVTSDGRKTRFDAAPMSPPCLGVGLQEPKDHSAKQGFENHPGVVQEDRLRDRRRADAVRRIMVSGSSPSSRKGTNAVPRVSLMSATMSLKDGV